MRLAFLDLCRWDYDVDTPWERPLGGSQSALAYLTVALAERGHRVRLFSRTSRPGARRGVDCVGFEGTLVPEGLAGGALDAVVVLNGPAEAGGPLREALGGAVPLLLWTQHAHDQPAMAALGRPVERAAWDGIVCVSEWQRRSLVAALGVAADRTSVLPNAVGPRYEALFAGARDLAAKKLGTPRLVYTSTPFRGLDVLLFSFERIRASFPETRLDVFSSMTVYQVEAERDGFAELYASCRETRGVRYRGSVPQPELVGELRDATLLAYPSTFAETSCIAVMESLAAGLGVVTTELGALPETCRGHAVLVERARPGTDGLVELGERFADAVVALLERRRKGPEAFAQERWRQVQDLLATCTWARRAAEWERVLEQAGGGAWGGGASQDRALDVTGA